MFSLHSTRRWHGELSQSTLLTAPSRREPSDGGSQAKVYPCDHAFHIAYATLHCEVLHAKQSFALHYLSPYPCTSLTPNTPPKYATNKTPHPSMRQTKHPTQVRGEFRPLHPCMRLSKKQATKIFRRLLNLLFTFILYTNNAMTSNCLHFSNHPLHPYSYRLFYFPNLFDWKFYATRLYL